MIQLLLLSIRYKGCEFGFYRLPQLLLVLDGTLFFICTDTFEISDLTLEFSDFFSVAFGLFSVFTVFRRPLDAFSFPIFTAFYQF